MTDALLWHRIQFVFTITYHYLFPQLTMGLALLIVVFKSLALRLGDESYNEVARFWSRIFALNFAMGVVTGIPMEFQFGTNWSRFSLLLRRGRGAGAGDGGYLRLLPRVRPSWACSCSARSGSARGGISRRPSPWPWARGSRGTSSSSPTPSCSTRLATGWAQDGVLHLESFRAYIFNPWALWQYAHNMLASLVTASFVVAAVGAYWSLMGQHGRHAAICLRGGSSRGWSPACWSRSRPVTAPARWWRGISR